MKSVIVSSLRRAAAGFALAGAALVGGAASPEALSYLRPFGLGETRWTQGLWARQQTLSLTASLGTIRSVIDKPGSRAAFTNFLLVNRQLEATPGNCKWGDGDVYKYLETLTYAFLETGDAALDRELDERIAVIARAQQPNGYLHTVNQLAGVGFPSPQRNDHEDYNFGHLFTAAAAHHAITGKTTLLTVARKAADLLVAEFQGKPARAANYGWNPSHMMGLIELFHATGDRRYLELCRTFVDARGTQPTARFATALEPHPGDQNQMRKPLREETEAVGHAVTGTYLYSGAADLARETGDRGLVRALAGIWNDVQTGKVYVTGGVAAYQKGFSSRGDPVHEAFAKAHDLPHAVAYNETCSSFGYAMFSRRLLAATGEAAYADAMEQVLYNACLAAVSLDGERFFYANPVAWNREEQTVLHNFARERWRDWTCYCCPPQVSRVFGQLHRWAYATRGDDVWVHLYGGSALRATLPGRGAVELEQETDYPWSGSVRLTWKTAPTGATPLHLRIPGWASGATVSINGRPSPEPAVPGRYLTLARTWRAGDRVELELPLNPRLVGSNPLVESTVNQAAVMRGPVVYCLESPDLPEGVAVTDVRLPRGATFAPIDLPAPLERARGLRTEVLARPGLKAGREAPLYGPVSTAPARRVPVTLIPYFAWNNRGEPWMRVWLPLAD